MNDTVFVKKINEPAVDIGEIARYSGSRDDITDIIGECLSECKGTFGYNVCYREIPVKVSGATVDLGFACVESGALAKNLCGCSKAVIFAATVGIGIDRLIAKYGRISPSRAVIFSAIGAERIESLCNAFNDEINKEYEKQGLFPRPRFSPGYGDCPLNLQRDFFRVLDCHRKIGLTLNESFIMSPSKSVTAIIGFCDRKSNTLSGCLECENTDCAFRRER